MAIDSTNGVRERAFGSMKYEHLYWISTGDGHVRQGGLCGGSDKSFESWQDQVASMPAPTHRLAEATDGKGGDATDLSTHPGDQMSAHTEIPRPRAWTSDVRRNEILLSVDG